jgi:hypothetical protein
VEVHRARAGHLLEGEEGSDRWGPPVGGRGKRGAYPFRGFTRLGLGPVLGLGQFGSPGLFSFSLFSFPFVLFSDF